MNPFVLAIGDYCDDFWVYVSCSRLSPEIPVPCVVPLRRSKNPGMIGNTAKNLEYFGNRVFLLRNSEPIIKTRYIDDATGHNFLRVDENDKVNTPLSIDYLNTVLEINKIKDLYEFDFVVLNDYAKGYLTEGVIEYISKNSKLSFLDTKMVVGNWADEISFIKLNQKEFDFNIKNSNYFSKNNANKRLIVTNSSKGTSYMGDIYPVNKVDVVQQAGCGDTFMAAYATEYWKTKNIPISIQVANHFATLACSKKGVVSNFD